MASSRFLSCWRRTVAAVVLILLLSSCDQREMIRKMTPAEDDLFAREFIHRIIDGDVEGAMAALASTITPDDGRKGFAQLHSLFKKGGVKDMEVVGVYWKTGIGAKQGRTTTLTYQIELTTGWFVGPIIIKHENGSRRIESARFEPIPDSLERIHGLRLLDKPIWALLFLVLAIAIPLFIVFTLIRCARSSVPRKGLWIVFIIVGVSTLRLNWTTSTFEFQLLSIQLLGAMVWRASFAAPLTIGIGFPLGAVLFWLMRKQLEAKEVDEPPPLPPR